jgi:hypothetical protein
MCTPRVPPINPLKPLYSSVPGPVGVTISDLQDTVDVILKLKTEMKEILKTRGSVIPDENNDLEAQT